MHLPSSQRKMQALSSKQLTGQRVAVRTRLQRKAALRTITQVGRRGYYVCLCVILEQ